MKNEVIKQKPYKGANLERYGEFQKGKEKALTVTSTLQNFEILRNKNNLMEEILQKENMLIALQKVRENKGNPGVDKITIEELPDYLKSHWPKIKELLLISKYKPQPVMKVEIPKNNGGKRILGIPTVIDRLIQHAIAQVLSKYIDPGFVSQSFGFRPNRSAHQAIEAAVGEIKRGANIMIDIDIEKFFDTMNHDRMMSKLKAIIIDQRVLNVIRCYLNAGVQVGKSIEVKREGVPQGSPLSPLLSNLYLHDLDMELIKRKHKFVRYADDCKIFVNTIRGAKRVLTSIKLYLSKYLKLCVNESKSAIGKRSIFLGFEISKRSLRVTKQNIAKFKDKIRNTIRIRGGKSVTQVIEEVNPIINGWREYFKIQTTLSLFPSLDGWIRRRIRGLYYAHLKNGKKRYKAFTKIGVNHKEAHQCAYSSRGIWVNSNCSAIRALLNNRKMQSIGLACLSLC